MRLVGDPSKAERLLGWIRNHDFDKLIESMVQAELQNIQATKSQRRGPEMAINGGRQPPRRRKIIRSLGREMRRQQPPHLLPIEGHLSISAKQERSQDAEPSLSAPDSRLSPGRC